MVVVDFNTDMAALEGREQDKVIAVVLEEESMEDRSGHFPPCQKPWLKDGSTWAMHRGNWEVTYHINYILGTYSCLLQKIAVQDA